VIDAYFLILAWYALAAGLLLVGLGLIGRAPSGFSLGLAAGAEAGLVVQLILSIVLVSLGQYAATDTWEFFGYLIVALIIPVAGAIWALVERNRWSTVVLGAAVLTIAVMLVRMQQIWTGVNPFAV
jgi:asparagine N-glycosylation enzyme membrane subunit Stt3